MEDLLTIEPSQINVKENKELPHNLELEQHLLGLMLMRNDVVTRVSEFLLPEHFYYPIHQKIYNAILVLTEKGLLANPLTLKNYFNNDDSFKNADGDDYLSMLAEHAIMIIDYDSYAKFIYDFYLRRKLIKIGEQIVLEASNEELGLVANTKIERAEQELFHLATKGIDTSKSFQILNSFNNKILEKINKARLNKTKITGTSTGFADLDHKLDGFHDSDLIILAGRPSMGKTALALNLAANSCKKLYDEWIKNKKPTAIPPSVGFFSLEMSSEQLSSRILSQLSEIESTKLRTAHITNDEFEKLARVSNEISKLPFFIDDTPALSIAAIRARARRLKRQNNLRLLFIDYLQLASGVSKKSETNRVHEISEITQGLKAIAKELDIPIIALSQLSRQSENREDKKPQLSDLRESGSIEQDADIVLFIHREEYYLGRAEPGIESPKRLNWEIAMEKAKNVAEVIVAKHRNGPIGTVRLFFDGALTKFKDLEQRYDD